MTILKWQAPDKFEDGSAFGAADFGGFTFDVGGAPAVSVPAAWETDGTYELDISSFTPAVAGQRKVYPIRMYTVSKGGITSKPSPAVEKVIDERVPSAPFGVAVA